MDTKTNRQHQHQSCVHGCSISILKDVLALPKAESHSCMWAAVDSRTKVGIDRHKFEAVCEAKVHSKGLGFF